MTEGLRRKSSCHHRKATMNNISATFQTRGNTRPIYRLDGSQVQGDRPTDITTEPNLSLRGEAKSIAASQPSSILHLDASASRQIIYNQTKFFIYPPYIIVTSCHIYASGVIPKAESSEMIQPEISSARTPGPQGWTDDVVVLLPLS